MRSCIEQLLGKSERMASLYFAPAQTKNTGSTSRKPIAKGADRIRA